MKLPFFIANLLATIRLFGYLWRWNKHILSMEDILKFLLVAGVIIIGFVRQARKGAKNNPAPSRDDNDVPFPHETHPLPESWEGIPIPPPQPTDRPQAPKEKYRQTTEPFIPKTYQTQQVVPHDKPATQRPPHTNRHAETEDTTPAIDIQSAEEIRKGIIWSEILQRKY